MISYYADHRPLWLISDKNLLRAKNWSVHWIHSAHPVDVTTASSGFMEYVEPTHTTISINLRADTDLSRKQILETLGGKAVLSFGYEQHRFWQLCWPNNYQVTYQPNSKLIGIDIQAFGDGDQLLLPFRLEESFLSSIESRPADPLMLDMYADHLADEGMAAHEQSARTIAGWLRRVTRNS